MTRKPSYDAIVIGAGHNGLIAAAYLARSGKKTLVLEQRDVPGGLASVYSEGRIQGGSTCAEHAGTLSPRIMTELGLASRGLTYREIDPLVRVLDPDGSQLTISRDESQTIREIARYSRRDADRFAAFAEEIESLSGVMASTLNQESPQPAIESGSDLLALLRLGLNVRQLGARLMHEMLRVFAMSAADFLDEWFEGELLRAALAASAVQGLCHGPRSVGTAALMLYRHSSPVSRPLMYRHGVLGGVGKVGEVLAETARDAGAELRLSSPVSRIETDQKGVAAVVLGDGTSLYTRTVLSCLSPRATLLELVDSLDAEPEFVDDVKNIRYRGCVSVLNALVDRLPKFGGIDDGEPIGLVQLGASMNAMEKAYDATKYGRISNEPFLLMSVPSQDDPSAAPEGKHRVSIHMQYAPYALRQGSWREARGVLRASILASIERVAPGFTESIIDDDLITPFDYAEFLNCSEGQWDQGEATLDQILFMRPAPGWARYRMPIRGLYLCGAGTHPGGGLIGAPGYNAAHKVLRDRAS